MDYLCSLRVIMNTYAYCDTHQVASCDDAAKQVTYFPFEAAHGYVDEVTVALQSIGLRSEQERLTWLRKRDETVRSEMVALLNDGFSGGEALTRAWSKHAHLWIMRDHTVAAAADPDFSQQPPQKRQKGEPGAGKGKSKGKQDNGKGMPRTASMDNKGRKICGAFNSKKGCTHERSCPQRGVHVCSVLLPNGGVCGKQHSAISHFSGAW